MNTIDKNKVRLACPTCGISEITSTPDDHAVKYFAIQRDAGDGSLGTIKKAVCRTCASAAIIQEHKGD